MCSGPRAPALVLGAITHSIVADHSTISMAVDNPGNVRLAPTVELVLWDSTGAEVTRFGIAMDTVYAHTDTLAQIPFTQRLNAGMYTVQVNLVNASGVSASSGKVPLLVAESAPLSVAPAPAAAQTNQTSAAPANSVNGWTIAVMAFGAGLVVMLAVGGLGFAIYRRRFRARGDARHKL
jgi:hypothetical protein